MLFGIGGGWNAEEMEHHGTAWKSRWRLFRERVLAMKTIWTEREASYQGEFVRFDKIWADPKPLQKPHPPIFIGGDGEKTFDRVVEFGDGWMPIMRPHANPVEKIPALRERLKTAGRDPKSVPVSIFFAHTQREALDALAAAGVTRAIFGRRPSPRLVLPRSTPTRSCCGPDRGETAPLSAGPPPPGSCGSTPRSGRSAKRDPLLDDEAAHEVEGPVERRRCSRSRACLAFDQDAGHEAREADANVERGPDADADHRNSVPAWKRAPPPV